MPLKHSQGIQRVIMTKKQKQGKGKQKVEKPEFKVLHSTLKQAQAEEVELLTATAMEKFQIDKDVAQYVKREIEKKYSGTWNCIIGQVFCYSHTFQEVHIIMHRSSFELPCHVNVPFTLCFQFVTCTGFWCVHCA